MSDIFLSYRRDDSPSATGRLAEALQGRFGDRSVFRDLDSIPLGEDFTAALRRAIRAAAVQLVVIGPRWLDARSADGARRLDDPGDFVRLEIEAALGAGIGLVPVLVEGASMPSAQQLPESLAALSRCQAAELSELRWRFDTDRLMTLLQARFGIESQTTAATSPAPSGAAKWVTRFGLDLLELAGHPTRLIARRQTGAATDLLRAAGFMLVCFAIGLAALLIGLGGRPDPAAAKGLFAGAKLVAVGVLVNGLIAAGLAALLALAWRLCGIPAASRRVALVFAYVCAGAWLGFCLGALVLTTGIQLGDAQVIERVFGVLYAPDPAGVVDLTAPERWTAAQAQLTRAFQGRGVLPVVSAGVAMWPLTALWTFVAWGAFRHALDVGRARAVLATAIWLALLAGLVALAARLG